MSGETTITIVGNLGGDPELRFTPSGAAVCNFNIGSTPRTFDKAKQEWVDGETLWLRCSVWREQAENVAESLSKGDRVIAQGNLKSRTYETKEGEKRTVTEVDITEIGPSLKNATAKVTKAGRGNGQQARGGNSGGFGGQGASGGFEGAQGQWGQGGGFGQDDSAPF